MNTMTFTGYQATIGRIPRWTGFGETLGLNGEADSCGRNPRMLRAESRKSLRVFLEACVHRGDEPLRRYSGEFNLRSPPELYERLVIVAQVEGKSVNTQAREALQHCSARSVTSAVRFG